MSDKDKNDMSLPVEIQKKYQSINIENLKQIVDIWGSIYGPNDNKFMERLSKVERDLQAFWEYQIDEAQERKLSLLKSIEKTGAQVVVLEKALGLPSTVNTMQEDIPLVQLEEQLWKLLDSCQELKQKRLEEFLELKTKEKMLCDILDESPEILDLPDHSMESDLEIIPTHPKVVIPSCETLAECDRRIAHLQSLLREMEYDFEKYKDELYGLLMECEVTPLTPVELFAFSDDTTEVSFPVTKKNLNKLKDAIKTYTDQKKGMKMQSDHLKEEITKLSRKLLKDPEHLKTFFSLNNGFGKSTLDKLKQKLNSLKEERSHKLKDLVLNNRLQLDELWTRCCYSDEQRMNFEAYNADYYNEEVLELHELELEGLQAFYERNKQIFQLANRHQELWDRLLHLESEASHADRLFSNRGGRLLQEEKERKLIQKKLPAITSQLVTLLNEYRARTNEDFLYLGKPLLKILEEKERVREASKENQKISRKMANNEQVLVESRLGTRPVVGAKRKMANQPPNSSSKVFRAERPATRMGMPSPGRGLRAEGTSYATLHTPVRTPAASTPENGSPSYESFQEHIEKLSGREVCRSSTKSQAQRILRPRNINNTTVTKIGPTVNPCRTPKTPVKTPSKIPFRIATGSKIPSIVPPISPRNTKKLTTPRSRLPLIF